MINSIIAIAFTITSIFTTSDFDPNQFQFCGNTVYINEVTDTGVNFTYLMTGEVKEVSTEMFIQFATPINGYEIEYAVVGYNRDEVQLNAIAVSDNEITTFFYNDSIETFYAQDFKKDNYSYYFSVQTSNGEMNYNILK